MNRDQLRQQLNDMRQHMFNEGILTDYFRSLEFADHNIPRFLEDLIKTYFSTTPAYIDELKRSLDTRPLDYENAECVIIRLKGASASMGGARLVAATQDMLDSLRANRFDELDEALENIRVEHTSLKSHLEQYGKLLKRLRLMENLDEDGDSSDSSTAESSCVINPDDPKN